MADLACTEENLNFIQRWAELISLLGAQVTDSWQEVEGDQSLDRVKTYETFDKLFQAAVLLSSHPSRVSV